MYTASYCHHLAVCFQVHDHFVFTGKGSGYDTRTQKHYSWVIRVALVVPVLLDKIVCSTCISLSHLGNTSLASDVFTIIMLPG